jgi:hypothetical protein
MDWGVIEFPCEGLEASLSIEGCGVGHTPVPDVAAGADEGLRMKVLSELAAHFGDTVSAERVGTDGSRNLASTGTPPDER